MSNSACGDPHELLDAPKLTRGSTGSATGGCGRGSIDDHKVYQEVQGRRTIPLLQAYDYPFRIIDKEEEIEDIPNAYEWHRLQKRPFVLFLTKKLLGTAA